MQLASPSPGPGPVLAKLNARLGKLNLVKRFPLHNVVLKRCPTAAGRAGGGR